MTVCDGYYGDDIYGHSNHIHLCIQSNRTNNIKIELNFRFNIIFASSPSRFHSTCLFEVHHFINDFMENSQPIEWWLINRQAHLNKCTEYNIRMQISSFYFRHIVRLCVYRIKFSPLIEPYPDKYNWILEKLIKLIVQQLHYVLQNLRKNRDTRLCKETSTQKHGISFFSINLSKFWAFFRKSYSIIIIVVVVFIDDSTVQID